MLTPGAMVGRYQKGRENGQATSLALSGEGRFVVISEAGHIWHNWRRFSTHQKRAKLSLSSNGKV
jgi:hypothetical protein